MEIEMQASHASTTRRALFAAGVASPFAMLALALPASELHLLRLESQMDGFLAEITGADFTDGESEDFFARSDETFRAVVALPATSAVALRLKAKAMLMLFGGSFDDLLGEGDSTDEVLRSQIVVGLLGAAR